MQARNVWVVLGLVAAVWVLGSAMAARARREFAVAGARVFRDDLK